MKVAFVDLMFSWPPHGGAAVDLFEIMRAAHGAGHEVKLFATSNGISLECGVFDPEALPFPAERIEVAPKDFNRHRLPGILHEAVSAYAPGLVYFGCAFTLKPYLINAFPGYKKVARYYSYEAACQRSFLQHLDDGPCPKDYFATPNFCRKCAIEGQREDLFRDVRPVWTEEYLASEAYQPDYYPAARKALESLDAAIVYNRRMAAPLEDLVPRILMVPGGVDPDSFPSAPEPPASGGRLKILMTGRCEDPLKGVEVLRQAGEELARVRDDFEMVVTLPEDRPRTPWFRPAGWRSHDEVRELYREAAVCVVPSLWEEPFGIVAVEAMATGRPVCASRVGGLQHIVRDGETGFLFDAGDAPQLAKQLTLLLDDPALRARMGSAGREIAERHYGWKTVFDTYYAPLFAELTAGKERVP